MSSAGFSLNNDFQSLYSTPVLYSAGVVEKIVSFKGFQVMTVKFLLNANVLPAGEGVVFCD